MDKLKSLMAMYVRCTRINKRGWTHPTIAQERLKEDNAVGQYLKM